MTDIYSIDWNYAWNNPGPDNKKDPSGCSDRWTNPDKCRKFDSFVKKDNYKGSAARIKAMDINPHSRVLDIGAGPGSLAVPLSSLVEHVTAVEPSPGMTDCLYGNIKSRGIKNIDVVMKKWEDVVPLKDLSGPYDIVFASYSLGVPDLREALSKMNEVSSKYVYIFWFSDMLSSWRRNYREIWGSLFNEKIPCKRCPNIIYNLLGQMGIYANVEVTKEEHVTRYKSVDEAVSDVGYSLMLKESFQFDILKNYLEMRLVYENGVYLLKNTSFQDKIWWQKDFQENPRI
ncbi:SAM-dependent methyltransferase [Methanomicrobium sp. W14]|uniref:class I SAM-dependent methyltransferase n=1 Tax=Methanomicrobium sp. W14 TaxID=2817839 RepID=UPI001AE34F7C|nr:class I SAM-dependent methyltransferase [Methanomicrobium sp. W14]MBP2134036.1 SAM-dependent methyltransferase [Methanomicrobium sp. W14]